jgi:hypothetical protein
MLQDEQVSYEPEVSQWYNAPGDTLLEQGVSGDGHLHRAQYTPQPFSPTRSERRQNRKANIFNWGMKPRVF